MIQHPGRGCRKNKGNCCPTASPRVTPIVCLNIHADSRWFFTPASDNHPPPSVPTRELCLGAKAMWTFKCQGSKDNYREITSPGTSWWQWWGVSPNWTEGQESPGCSKLGELSYDTDIAATSQPQVLRTGLNSIIIRTEWIHRTWKRKGDTDLYLSYVSRNIWFPAHGLCKTLIC